MSHRRRLGLRGAEISGTAQDKEVLGEPRTLLACCRDRSFSRRSSAAAGCARRHPVGFGTNRQGLRYDRSSPATSCKGSDANCQSQREHCSHGCARPLHAMLPKLATLRGGHLYDPPQRSSPLVGLPPSPRFELMRADW
jgi:hypothetical protein